MEEGYSSCFKKAAYSSGEKAREVARRRVAAAGIELDTYKCCVCARWHLTQRNKREKAA